MRSHSNGLPRAERYRRDLRTLATVGIMERQAASASRPLRFQLACLAFEERIWGLNAEGVHPTTAPVSYIRPTRLSWMPPLLATIRHGQRRSLSYLHPTGAFPKPISSKLEGGGGVWMQAHVM